MEEFFHELRGMFQQFVERNGDKRKQTGYGTYDRTLRSTSALTCSFTQYRVFAGWQMIQRYAIRRMIREPRRQRKDEAVSCRYSIRNDDDVAVSIFRRLRLADNSAYL
ncbi:hypothetical protein BIW11_02902 [Tropilaelaps mercedesae]|uniref:Uncharacterized protein n=1 Tax=Tropilaelaps mercedesae TaxID=418985 RepID=A0A1V9XVL7_9ACAR|nr:hypothetical protein BIW11_02902 [Tropilaelaps mercedesae]